MVNDEIRAEITRQVHDALVLLATKLRGTAQHHGPVVEKALTLIADEIDQLP